MGAKFEKINVKYFTSNYRGVVATKNIKKDEVIIQIPKKAFIQAKCQPNHYDELMKNPDFENNK